MAMRLVPFKWGKLSKKQLQVLSWWAKTSPVKDFDGIICDGSIRSGKTVAMTASFVLWAMHTFDRENFAMCGKTIGSFRRNVLAVLKKMLIGRGYQYEDRRADNMLIIRKNGKENYFYIFGGKDERSQDLIQGITLAGVLFDEVALMPESFVNQATSRCSVDGSKFWFNCNPENPRHWFKLGWLDRKEERNLLHLHFTMEDNLTLSETVRKRYESQYTGVFYDRFILGLWKIATGLVYNFTEDNITDEIPEEGEYFISIDYGTLNPCSMGLWCVNNGKAVRIKEYYYSGRDTGKQKTDEEYHAELVKLADGRAIEWVVVDPSAASFITTIKKHGIFRAAPAKNDVIDGIRYTAGLLQEGRIKIHRECEACINEFGLYRWDESATKDMVVKDNDHAMDDMRYFAYTVMHKLFYYD